MKTTINELGVLVIIPETGLDSFALGKWIDTNGIPVNMKFEPFESKLPIPIKNKPLMTKWDGVLKIPLHELSDFSINKIEEKGYSPEYVTVKGLNTEFLAPDNLPVRIEFKIPEDVLCKTKWFNTTACEFVTFKKSIDYLIYKYGGFVNI